MREIDIVIPYVNGNDSEWLKEFNKYSFKPKEADGTKDIRYNGDDSLKYVFRSIDMYCPWVRKVHLLVMMDSQVPEWVDREKVHVVYHKDFMPEEHLPTFNSSAIEMYLWNIPDCSEFFLYANDDMFFNSYVHPEDYFNKDGKLRQNIRYVAYKSHTQLNAAYFSTFMSGLKLGFFESGKSLYLKIGEMLQPEHHIKPFRRSILKEFYDKYKDIIENSITRFRAEHNLNQYVFTYYEITNNLSLKSSRKCKYFRNAFYKHNDILQTLKNSDIVETCINDVNDTTLDDKIWMISQMENKYPYKSVYEK